MSYITDDKLKTIKDQMTLESYHWHNRPRFGLFSHITNLPVTDGVETRPTTVTDSRTRLLSAPKGIIGGKYKSGRIVSDVFSQPEYQNDAYEDPFRITRLRDSRGDQFAPNRAFRPSGANKKPVSHGYEYILDPHEPTRMKTFSGPKNFITAPAKKGYGSTTVGHLFSKEGEYVSDPFERAKDLATNEHLDHKARYVSQHPFRSTSTSKGPFSTNYQVYNLDELPPKMQRSSTVFSIHQRPFVPNNPAKRGYNKTINPFPTYKDDPLFNTGETAKIENKEERPWRYTYNYKSKPSPSVWVYNGEHRPQNKL